MPKVHPFSGDRARELHASLAPVKSGLGVYLKFADLELQTRRFRGLNPR